MAMSRAAFARRFKDLVGSTPLAYPAGLRVDLAARLLRDTDSLVDDIARSVGYASEFAFSRAFSHRHGLPPGRYRRHTPAPAGV
ncbi:helix-turn-helix transcriptional regulator [Streptomyces sp. R301]|uniref:helix-turn-helix transcriptional regulator n=1 Tax=unclassified Streptomyces TaxID=2593676 RepID=UPI003211E005